MSYLHVEKVILSAKEEGFSVDLDTNRLSFSEIKRLKILNNVDYLCLL